MHRDQVEMVNTIKLLKNERDRKEINDKRCPAKNNNVLPKQLLLQQNWNININIQLFYNHAMS